MPNISLPISEIRMDGGTQPRAAIDYAVVTDYADDMTEGASFPPVVVFYDGAEYWLADGFHRMHAAQRCGWIEIDAEVIQGTRRDAVLYSVSANATHGMRRTNADKRRAVETLLRDEEWSAWTDSEVGRRCAVDHKTVASVRLSLGNFPSERTYTTKHGTVSTMQTAGIGKRETVERASIHREEAPTYTPDPDPYTTPAHATDLTAPAVDNRLSFWLIRVAAMVDGILLGENDMTAREAYERALTVCYHEGEFTLTR